MTALKKWIFSLWMVLNCSTLFGQAHFKMNLFGETFEQIVLDGQAAFINQSTNEVISPEEYFLQTNDTTSLLYIFPADQWDTLKVNPYRGLPLEYPFKLEFFETDFAPPIEKPMVITSHFGKRKNRAHYGIDIDLETGDKVFSILPGKVRFVGYSRGHGHTVVVRHYNGLETVYAHLSRYAVKVNDVVSKGQVLGLGGATGNARGSHLHLEVRYNGRCINPEYLFDFASKPIIRSDSLLVTRTWVNPQHHSSYRESNVEIVTEVEIGLED